jgi:hypothetical protein
MIINSFKSIMKRLSQSGQKGRYHRRCKKSPQGVTWRLSDLFYLCGIGYIIPPIPPIPPGGIGGIGGSSLGFSATIHWVVSISAATLAAF